MSYRNLRAVDDPQVDVGNEYSGSLCAGSTPTFAPMNWLMDVLLDQIDQPGTDPGDMPGSWRLAESVDPGTDTMTRFTTTYQSPAIGCT